MPFGPISPASFDLRREFPELLAAECHGFFPTLDEMVFWKPSGQSFKKTGTKNYPGDGCSRGGAQPRLEGSSTLLAGCKSCPARVVSLNQCVGSPMRGCVRAPCRNPRRRRSRISNHPPFADQTAQLCMPGDLINWRENLQEEEESRFLFSFPISLFFSVIHIMVLCSSLNLQTGKTEGDSQ